MITTLLKNRITKPDCKTGYILDGYPRNLKQAKTYQSLLEELNYDKSCVIFLDIDKDIALKRSPVEIWGILYVSFTNFDWVPLPAAGGAINIIFFILSSTFIISI